MALIEQGQKHTLLQSGDSYVHLYPQRFNCAILYSPASKYAERGPLHLNPHVRSWSKKVSQEIEPFIEYGEPDKNDFDFCHVKDWNGFAMALKLELS